MKPRLLSITVKRFKDERVAFFASDSQTWERPATTEEMKWAYGQLALRIEANQKESIEKTYPQATEVC